MEVLTGKVVLSETHYGQSAGLFEASVNTLALSDVPGGQTTTTIEFPGGFQPKSDNNTGTIVKYSDLTDGLYWIYIIDKSSDVIRYMRTIRKGV